MVPLKPVPTGIAERSGGLTEPDPLRATAGPAHCRDTPLSRMFALCSREQYREYLPEKRSVRIHGHSTTLRLERAFWTVLEEMALDEGVTPGALITRIHDHCLVTNEKNLASCLRVVCLKYINLGP